MSSEPVHAGDEALIRRIIAGYATSTACFQTDGSFWTGMFGGLKAPYHGALLQGDAAGVADILRRPAANAFHYGFDEIYARDLVPIHGISHVISEADWLYDNLRRIAEAVGVCRLAYPEVLPGYVDPTPPTEELLSLLDAAFGFRIDFPNPFGGERGLETRRGVAGFRALQSLYQAWRIHEITRGERDVRVLEIGAGLGRTAYYSRRFGLRSYTIVDIPLTAAAAANYLGRVLGAGEIALFGEAQMAPISIVPPDAFLRQDDRYDMILNVDSLTEMAFDTACSYWRKIQASTSVFLSINHEVNPFTFRDIYNADPALDVTRSAYWLRRGYVDELVRFERR